MTLRNSRAAPARIIPGGRIALTLLAACTWCGAPCKDTWTTGTKTVLVIPVRFTDVSGPSDAPGPGGYLSAWGNMLDGTTPTALDNFFSHQSYGKLHMQFTILPEIDMGVSYTTYNANYPGTSYSKYTLWYEPGSFADDVRQRARDVGLTTATPEIYDTDNYDLDIMACGFIPGQGTISSGQPYVKGVFALGFKALGHELTHNLGLQHANGYSRATLYSPLRPGTFLSDAYGDVYDLMGYKYTSIVPLPPDRDVNPYSKNLLGWMGADSINTLTTSGTYRLHAFDAGSLEVGNKYALRIVRDANHVYWLDYRGAITGTDATWSSNGLEVHLGGESVPASSGQTTLIDTTPGSLGLAGYSYSTMHDAPLAIGRTFSDVEGGIHVTPVTKGGTTPESLDVVANFGTFPGNHAPTVSILPSNPSVTAGVAQPFTATAADSDGDTLSYYWEFDDLTAPGGAVAGNGNPDSRLATGASHTWTTNGTYYARCTVSDMKGRSTIASTKVTVTGGLTGLLTISGTVKDELGNPLPGAIVNNYKPGTVAYGAANFVASNVTGPDGQYVIPLPAGNGTYVLTAMQGGYTFSCNAAGGAVTVSGSSRTTINFTRTRTTRTISGAVVVAGRAYDPATDGALTVSDGTQVTTATLGSWSLNIPDGSTRTLTASAANPAYTVLNYFPNPYTVVDDCNVLHFDVKIPGKLPEVQFQGTSAMSDDMVGTVDIPIQFTLPAGSPSWPADQGVFCWVDDSSTAEYGVDYIGSGGYKVFRAGSGAGVQNIPIQILHDGLPKTRTIVLKLGQGSSLTNLGPTTTFTYTINNSPSSVEQWSVY